MGSNVLSKLIISILIMVLTVSMCYAFAYAGEPAGGITGDNFQLSQFDSEEGGGVAGGTVEKAANEIIGAIIGVMRIVCVGIAIIMLTMLAVKYIMAAPGDRAEIKKSAVQYVVGAVVLFGSAGILAIIENVVTEGIGLES